MDLSDKHKYGHGSVDLENVETREQIKEIAKEVKAPVVGTGSEFYSTKEQRIGYWVDGKPLYRKIWTNLSYNTAGKITEISIADLNIDTLCYSIVTRSFLVGTQPATASNYRICAGINKVTNKLYSQMVESGTLSSTGTLDITLEYTKTTDISEITYD